jgi:alpha-beta hydrolase superfamily lysophospholipase
MINKQWTWKSQDGLEMFSRSWEPETPKAVVCLVHGLGEHSGRYAHVGAAYTDAGFALVAFDLRGHGKSGGQRGHFPSFAAVMDDIHQHIRQGSEKFPGLPVFLYGHSLGGLLVLNYATYHKHTLTGVIASGAGLRSPVLEQKAKVALSKVLGGLLPTMTIPTGLEVDGISRNPEVVRTYKADALVHEIATLSTAREGMLAVERAFAHAAEFPVPLLLMHGGADRLTYPRGSQEFVVLVPGDCTLKLWDGLYHEIHNEPEQAEVFAFMIDWMNTLLRSEK